MSRWWTLVLCVTITLAPLSPLMAQDTKPLPTLSDLSEGQQNDLASLIDLAENSAQRGDYQKALGYYQDAFKIFPHPKLNHKLGECYERLGLYREAIDNFEHFLKLMPSAAQAPETRRRLRALRDKEQRDETSLRIKSNPPGAVVYLNDEANGAVGTTPTIDLPVAPGTYTVILVLDGYERAEVVVEVPGGQAVSEMVGLKAIPKEVEEPEQKRRVRGGSPVPVVLTVVGGVATASAVGFGMALASSQESQDPEVKEEGKVYELGMWASAGVAVISFVGALALWMGEDGPRRAELESLPAAPGVSGWGGFVTPEGGAGLSVFGRF